MTFPSPTPVAVGDAEVLPAPPPEEAAVAVAVSPASRSFCAHPSSSRPSGQQMDWLVSPA